jgi:hypothetical protein
MDLARELLLAVTMGLALALLGMTTLDGRAMTRARRHGGTRRHEEARGGMRRPA